MQKTIVFPDQSSYNVLTAISSDAIIAGHNRNIVTITVDMNYNEAINHFVDGAIFTLTDETGESYLWDNYGIAGPITDHRNGTITAVMGKNNTIEQDLEDKINTANQSILIIAGKSVENAITAADVRSQIESMYVEASSIMTNAEKISKINLAPEWKMGVHKSGDVFRTKAQSFGGIEWDNLWKVYQDYDNSIYPDITPGSSSWLTFNIPYHGTTPETALPFVPNQPAHSIYQIGEYMTYTDGYIYKCISPTSYSPEEYSDAWEIYKK